MKTILIVEDDQAWQKKLNFLFEAHGYGVVIKTDGTSALESLYAFAPTAIILDLRAPVMCITDLCRKFRQQSSAPVVVLTALTDVAAKARLLELGSDDYVSKPFSPRELLARVQTAIRRAGKPSVCDRASFDNICVDFGKMQVTREGRSVELTTQEFMVLKAFIQNAGQVISREKLIRQAFGYKNYRSARLVDNYVSRLRLKLEQKPASPVHFCTTHPSFYKFVP